MENTQSCIRAFANKVQIANCRVSILDHQHAFEALSSLLALAGNEVRLKILLLLEAEGELCPCDLADILEMSVPAVSQHLRKLKDGEVVRGRRDGQTIFYALKPEKLDILKPLFKHIVNQKSKLHEQAL
ncbi:MAG: metalloregulator ArsR/SmtB family transcription factor [Bacteroidetes bacterium]|nr:metalloregulator ArsR/SmtB family transcription factor [Bacteroidota bacterium]